MGVTIYDLAREAGVGIGTVSRCLNNHPHVSARTRARVLSVVKRLNYQPHAQAQRLASRRTNTIAVIIPSFTNYFFVQILQGVQDLAAEVGMDLILYGVNHTVPGRTIPAPVTAPGARGRRHVLQHEAPGILCQHFRADASSAGACRRLSPRLRFDQGGEHRRRAWRRRSIFWIWGTRAIAMINASLDAQPAQRTHGRVPPCARGERHTVPGRSGDHLVGWERMMGSTAKPGATRCAGCLRCGISRSGDGGVHRERRPGHRRAGGARAAGVRVPEDLAVVSFDDIELAQYAELTTMRQPMYEMGRLAMEKLDARMKDPDAAPTLTSFLPTLLFAVHAGPDSDSPGRPAALHLASPIPQVVIHQEPPSHELTHYCFSSS